MGWTLASVMVLLSLVAAVRSRRAQVRLRESEARFRSLFENMAEGVALHEIVRDERGVAVDYRVVDVNPQFERIIGLKRQDVAGKLATEAYGTPEPPYADLYFGVAAAREPSTFTTFFPPMDKHFAISVVPWGESGFATIFQDVTATQRAVEALRENEALLLESQRIARIGSYVLEVASGQWRGSEGLDEIFGIDAAHPRTVEGWLGIVHPDWRDEMRRYLREDVLGKRQNFEKEYVVLRPSDGETRWVYGRGVLEADDAGALLRMHGIIQDITARKGREEERRRFEQQLQHTQKLESLGVLAGGIAHDFNNILMAVLGHADLALDELSPASPARGRVRAIAEAARHAAELCGQMLAYAGKSSMAPERVRLPVVIEEMAHLLKTSISKKAILNLNLERDLPPVQADPSQLRQIVMNLLINASDAIGDRSGVITVSVGATRCDEEYLSRTELQNDLRPGLFVHLEVADTGCGMDAATRKRIFEPFFTTKFTGRGLGLAAVLGIVKAHGGALKVYSEPGQGTTFKILFPAVAEGSAGRSAEEAAPEPSWRGQGTVLLADDEESVRAVCASMLERLGLSVLTAADGREAVELYRARGKEIDLVILDLTMPHLGGADAFGELRRLDPDVRVVLASGYSKEDVAARVAGKGLAGVLQKPYTLAKVRELLAGILPPGG